MTYLSVPFPERVSMGAQGGPGYDVSVVVTDGGYEHRNLNSDVGLMEFDVSHAGKREDYAKEVLAFFRLARGKFHTFGYKDWLDYKLVDALGDGVLVALDDGGSPILRYQIYKRYGAGTATEELRKITRLKTGTVTVDSGTIGTVDVDRGIIHMASGTPTTCNGEFYVPSRFNVDAAQQRVIDRNLTRGFIVNWDQISIIEVRE